MPFGQADDYFRISLSSLQTMLYNSYNIEKIQAHCETLQYILNSLIL